MTLSGNYDFAIVGGGVIGLSIAWHLSSQGSRVVLVERNKTGSEASWCGAGILPPSTIEKAVHPMEYLAAISFQTHAQWAETLQRKTGIDTGFRRCSSMFIARTSGEVAALTGQCSEWQETGVVVEQLTAREAVERVPVLSANIDQIRMAAMVPDEVQIRNPHHLRALVAACQSNGVTILEEQGSTRLSTDGNRINSIKTDRQPKITASKYCLAAGAWTQSLAEQIGVTISTLPVRGQMLLYRLPERLCEPILYEGTRYIVSRDDGHVLVGSTLEEAGFDKSTTVDGIAGLKEFAFGLVNELVEDKLIESWAGLRPATYDGFPYLGPVPHLDNTWIATGHFRAGLLLSTGTALLMTQMMNDQPPMLDAAPFRVDRG